MARAWYAYTNTSADPLLAASYRRVTLSPLCINGSCRRFSTSRFLAYCSFDTQYSGLYCQWFSFIFSTAYFARGFKEISLFKADRVTQICFYEIYKHIIQITQTLQF
jgi:hypothetical protein